MGKNTRVVSTSNVVKYVEPNYSNAEFRQNRIYNNEDGFMIDTSYPSVYSLSPDLEDLSIYVNLKVDLYERGGGGLISKDGHESHLMTWNGKTGQVSFLRGTNFEYGKRFLEGNDVILEFGETEQYFSTAPYEYTTYRDIDTMNNANSEMFGIKSIDISYNNYNVPEVTIQFTDIRGMSLIGAEELRHRFNSNGIQNSVDESVSGSFFKAFFMFPYPKFELMVKGFYGKPTTYQLTCSGFKTRFDCSTGNFEATATFLGYNHALLNDVMLTAIVCATRDKFYGKQYWDAKVADYENSGFYFESKDGLHVSMSGHDVLDVVNAIPKLGSELERFNQDDESVVTMNKSEEIISSINAYIDSLKNLHRSIIASAIDENCGGKSFEAKNGVNDNVVEATYIYIDDTVNDKFRKNGDFASDVVKSKVEVVKEQRKRLEDAMKDCPPPAVEYIKEIITSDKLTQLKEKSKCTNDDFEKLKSNGHVYLVNYQDIISTLEVLRTDFESKFSAAQTDVENRKVEVIKKVLNFEPTIENFTKLFLCQMETLIHSIYQVEYEVKGINESSNKRTLQSMSNGRDTLSSVDINDDNIIGGIPAFPRIEVIKQKTSGSTKEEGWIGNVTTDDMAPEIKLIHGLLEAVTDARTCFDDVNNEMAKQAEEAKANAESKNKNDNGVTNGRTSTMAEQIASVIDVITNNNPFSKIDDFTDYSDIFGKVANRCFGSIGLNSNNIKYTNAAEELGKADAINFAKINNQPDKDFLTKLNNNGFNADEIVNGLADRNTTLKKEGGGYAWNKGAKNRSGGMITFDGNKSRYTLIENAVIPLGNISWDDIHNNKNENYFYYSGQDSEKKGTENLFRIDEKYQRYQSLENSFTRGSDNFSKIKGIFGVSGEEFKVNSKSISNDFTTLSVKFINNGEHIDFDNISDESYILPTDKSVINKIKHSRFYGGRHKLNDSFDSIEIDNRTITRKNNSSFKALYTNLESKSYYTIPSFNGFSCGHNTIKINEGCSLFGQSSYYSNTNKKARALLFLESFGNVFSIENFVNEVTNSADTLSFIPKIVVLMIGAYIERGEKRFNVSFKNNNNFNVLGKLSENFTLTGKQISSVFKLKNNIKVLFTQKFDEWVETEFSKIQENYELRPNNNGLTDVSFLTDLNECLNNTSIWQTLYNAIPFKANENVFSKYVTKTNKEKNKHYKTFEALLADNFNENFFKNYISLKGNDYGLKLYNRETSEICDDIVNMLSEVNSVIKTSQYISSNASYITMETSHLKNYFRGFIKQLKNEYENVSKASSDSNNSNSTHIGAGQMVNSEASEDIKIALYRYIKLLYDRWLSGNPQNNWDVKNFFLHWHFIDAYYNVIGDIVYVNIINDFYGKLKASFNQPGYSIMSYLNDLFSTCRMNFNCVQNFLDLTQGENIKELFDPIPSNNISWGDVDFTPDFVAIYHGDESSKINLSDSSFKDDSFNLNTSIAEQPEAIKSKQVDVNLKDGQRHRVGYNIPAFGVTYGMQHQSYFKNIDVSMDSAMITQQAIETQFIIGEQNSTTDAENGRKLQSVGQDLYTIYSNNSYSCTVSMMGCAYIQPLMYFQLNNIPLFKGAYLIHKVNHHIEPGKMETSFVGVRQSAVQTPFIKNPFVERRNGKTYDGRDEYGDETARNGQMASIENNCQYKAFAVLSGQGASIDVDVPISTVSKKASELYSNETLLDVLARTVYAAVDSKDELSCQLTATVYYNRYANKKNWDNADLFGGRQIEWKEPKAQSADLNSEKIKTIKRYIRPIFESSPAYLVGRQNRIFKSVPIYRNSKKTDEYTKSGVTITIDVLKRIYYYASPYRYFKGSEERKPLGGEYSEEAAKNNKYCSHFITHEYGIQQDIDEIYGHVYLCETKDCWTEQTNKSNKDSKKVNKNPSELAEGLFNAVKKSAEYSEEASKKVINMKYKPTTDANVIKISCDNVDGNPYIYDILLNTYYDYISKLLWVSSDNKSVPSEIVVGVKETTTKNTKKLIGISNDGVHCCAFGDSEINFVEGKDKNINHLFLTILRKHYGIIPNDGSGDFKLDCANFTTFTKDRAVNWVDKINNLLKNDMAECGNQLASYDSIIMEGANISSVNNSAMNNVVKAASGNKIIIKSESYGKMSPTHNDDNTPNGFWVIGEESHHCCTSGPSTFYLAGGMNLFGKWWNSPKTATDAKFTHESGWKLVGAYEVSESNMIGQGLKPGDIAVMYSAKPSSHACMWNGSQWISDFKQKKCWVYGSDKVGRRSTNPQTDKPIQIWRYMPWQRNNVS